MRDEIKISEIYNGLEDFLTNSKELDITPTLHKVLKELKFNYESKGGYSRKVLVCRIEDNIDMIKKYCKDDSYIDSYFMMCSLATALITSIADVPHEFVEKSGMKPWHLNLMRRTYFDLSSDEPRHSYTNSKREFYLGDKRPYGNSNVTGDIAEEYFKINYDKQLKHNDVEFKWSDTEDDHPGIDIYDVKHDYVYENSDFFFNIMDETNGFIRQILKEVDYSHFKFIRKDLKNQFSSYYTSPWDVCETTYIRRLREMKLKNIVGNE